MREALLAPQSLRSARIKLVQRSKLRQLRAALRQTRIKISVGIFPTSVSCANGHPPRPPMAASKRRQPASYAARICAAASLGRACRCTPNSIVAGCAASSRRNCLRDLFGRRQGPQYPQAKSACTPASTSRSQASDDLVDAPRVAIGIPEGHRDIGDHIQPCARAPACRIASSVIQRFLGV